MFYLPPEEFISAANVKLILFGHIDIIDNKCHFIVGIEVNYFLTHLCVHRVNVSVEFITCERVLQFEIIVLVGFIQQLQTLVDSQSFGIVVRSNYQEVILLHTLFINLIVDQWIRSLAFV